MYHTCVRTTRQLAPYLVVAVLGMSSLVSTPALALNRWVELFNHTDYSLVQFFASNQDDPDWGHDRLGKHIIWPGDSISRLIDDGSGYCRYDFKAVFEDGDVLTEYGVNVCGIYEFRYY